MIVFDVPSLTFRSVEGVSVIMPFSLSVERFDLAEPSRFVQYFPISIPEM